MSMTARKLYDPSFTTEFREASVPSGTRKRAGRIITEKRSSRTMSKIYVTGLGPGAADQMTVRAKKGAGKMSGDHRIYSIY